LQSPWLSVWVFPSSALCRTRKRITRMCEIMQMYARYSVIVGSMPRITDQWRNDLVIVFIPQVLLISTNYL
jgi:hypothetical protein